MIASLPTSQKLDKNKSKTKTGDTEKVKKHENRKGKKKVVKK
jgi:hypothetical protein